MVRHLFFLVIFSVISITGFSQTIKEVFSRNTTITWLGLDFSKIKLYGNFDQFSGAGEKTPEDLRDVYFKAWNDLIINEPKKFNLEKAFQKSTVEWDLEYMEKRNFRTDADGLMSKSSSSTSISLSDIQENINEYKLDGKTGIGLVFIMESFNKGRETATMHIVFFNMASKEVLLAEKVTGSPGGFGIRNYWAGSIYHVLKQLWKGKFNQWNAKYN